MKRLANTAIVIFCVSLLGCASNIPVTQERSSKPSDTYTTSFPTRDVSDELKKIRKSVKRISSTGIYTTYYIEDRLFTVEDLKTTDVKDIATRTLTSTESTAGTAISVFNNQAVVGLLTNAHVINYPDTLIGYLDREGVPQRTFIKSVKIKKKQTNLVYDLPYVGGFEIVDYDDSNDLALLKVSKRDFSDLDAPTLRLTIGNPADLEWGSFVYIMGYPKGYPMLTRGIVSDPRRNDYHDFLTDALFNPGISGGLIIATRDNFNSFEWVGMTNTASADLMKILVPDPSKANEYENFDRYDDPVYVDTKTQLTYGITQSIPMKRIIEFLEKNERPLRRLGFRLNRFSISE